MEKNDKKILIVEDDEDFTYILQKKFTMEGFLVVSAKDGQEGIAMAEKENPDLIISDVLMPKMDGIAMAKKIREKNIDVPIIFLTNTKDTDLTIDAQSSDKFEYLLKSNTRIGEILEKVKNKLGIA